MAYLFTTFNAFQGVFIFVFHCALQKKVSSGEGGPGPAFRSGTCVCLEGSTGSDRAGGEEGSGREQDTGAQRTEKARQTWGVRRAQGRGLAWGVDQACGGVPGCHPDRTFPTLIVAG